MHRLKLVFISLGILDNENEMIFGLAVDQNVSQLEIYDQTWRVRDIVHSIEKIIDYLTIIHSKQVTDLAKQIIMYLEKQPSNVDCFPYDVINLLKETYWINENYYTKKPS